MTSFIGRSRKVAEISVAVLSSRLVTLIGPGGVGKTRLAVEAATPAREGFRDGVWMVDLAPVSDDELVPASLQVSIGKPEGRV